MFDTVLNMPLYYSSCFAMVLRGFNTERAIYGKLIIVYILQTKNFPLFWSRTWMCNIQASERLTKVKKKKINH